MQPVNLLIPGDPKPMQRPRAGMNKKTRKPIFFIPATTLAYQQLVRTAAIQPANLEPIRTLVNCDPHGRLTINVYLIFKSFRHCDPNNVLSNVFDGLVRAIGGNDNRFTGSIRFDVVSGREEGETHIEILPYTDKKQETLEDL